MTHLNAVKFISNSKKTAKSELLSARLSYLSSLLGDPHKRLNYIRLAGSNGKTICSAMLSSVLSEAGYSVCTLNMSLMSDPMENIRYNTAPISIPEFTELVDELHSACNRMKKNIELAKASMGEDGEPTEEFATVPRSLIESYPTSADVSCGELLLLTALMLCRKRSCKICLIESDHNGPDPSLFLKPPFAALICGAIPSNDKSQTAKIKSYIQKGINEVISAPQDTYAYKIISDACASVNCRLTVPIRSSLTVNQLSLLGTVFTYNEERFRLSLCGRFQTVNAITVIEAVKMLRRYGYNISPEAEMKGLKNVRLPSRFEVLSVNPTVIADSTYKNEAVEPVCESLFDFSEVTGRYISLCLPCERKLIESYLNMLGARGYKIEKIYTVSPDEEQALANLEGLPEKASLVVFPTVKSATRQIMSTLKYEDNLLISGDSAFTDKLRFEIMRYLDF